jgi:hypothetical protein
LQALVQLVLLRLISARSLSRIISMFIQRGPDQMALSSETPFADKTDAGALCSGAWNETQAERLKTSAPTGGPDGKKAVQHHATRAAH